MDNSYVAVEAGCVSEFQYVTQFKSWLNAGLPRFSRCKFHKHSVVCGKDADCWQAPFSNMAMVKVKEEMVSDFNFILSFSWYNTYLGLFVHLFK